MRNETGHREEIQDQPSRESTWFCQRPAGDWFPLSADGYQRDNLHLTGHSQQSQSFLSDWFTPATYHPSSAAEQNSKKNISLSTGVSVSRLLHPSSLAARICCVPMRLQGCVTETELQRSRSKTSAKASEKQTSGTWESQARVPGLKDVCEQAHGVDF